MLRIRLALAAWLCVFAGVLPVGATSYGRLDLHQQVQLSDLIVIARVVDSARALLSVERVFKGEAPKQIVLVAYIDRLSALKDQRPLIDNARELLFLKKQGDAYAPLQEQLGRLGVDGDRLIECCRNQPRRVAEVVASITRLAALQARAARGGVEADQTFVVALANPDPEVQKWATMAPMLVKVPSQALGDAYLAHWSKDVGTVANGVMAWRLRRAAPILAKILTSSADGDERGYAAMALGGTGDNTYLPLLRRVASSDTHPQARALAYSGIMWMIGTEALADLRLGAKDPHERVRGQAVVDAYNMLQFGWSQPLWPLPSDALVAEVRVLLTSMLKDPASNVRTNARSMLSMIAKHRP